MTGCWRGTREVGERSSIFTTRSTTWPCWSGSRAASITPSRWRIGNCRPASPYCDAGWRRPTVVTARASSFVCCECEKFAARAASDNVDHLGFLLQLTELELIERERKSAERRLKAARFPAHNTLDEFDFKARPSVNKPLVLQLIQGDYLGQRENIL